MSTPPKRVVITGLGLVSPIGSDLETVWQSLSRGISGVRRIQGLDCRPLPFQSGGEVSDFTGAIEDFGPLDKQLQRSIKKNMKVMCREIQMGVAASQKALVNSGLGEDRDPDRCGCIFGSDYILTRPEEYADGLKNCRELSGGTFDVGDWPLHGLSKVNPLWLLKYLPNMPNSHVSIYNDFRGPNNSVTVRDASMNLSIAEATSIIQRGAADVMLVGATGSRLHPLKTPHVLLCDQVAKEQPDPAQMSRPFDESSDGMVLGEGAGAIVLESADYAESRGARIWGEIIGHGAAMASQLEIAAESALNTAIQTSQKQLPKNWHVHAQGLGSQRYDHAEARALNRILEAFPQVPVTAAKSYFGNLGAGSGAVELICSLLAISNQRLFPILNLKTPLAAIRWCPANQDSEPGKAFVHSSFTSEGQACSIVVACR